MASDDLPRHLRIALANAERAIRAGDHAALGTINETIQPLVDAAMARISKSEAALRLEHEAHSALLTATRADRDRLRDILACERGERSPVGWVWTTYAIGDGNTHGEWQRRAPGIVLALSVWRGKEGTWHWQVHPPGGTQQGVAPTALEAIEAADHAAKERP